MAEKDRFEEVSVTLDIWLPEKVGDQITGIVKETREGTYGSQWLIGAKDGERWTPSHKVLQNRMNNVPIGSIVRITRMEDLPPKVRGHNPTTMYKVEVKK